MARRGLGEFTAAISWEELFTRKPAQLAIGNTKALSRAHGQNLSNLRASNGTDDGRQMTKHERVRAGQALNDEEWTPQGFRNSDFVIPSCFVIRHSSF
jgi:hypothetical protein